MPVLLQDASSGTQSNFTARRTNEVMAFPYKLMQQRSDVALYPPWVGFKRLYSALFILRRNITILYNECLA
jgi:hypothetical protein